MNMSHLCKVVGLLWLGLAVQASVAQGGPRTPEQVGKDPGALRQEAEQQRARQQREQQRQSQQQADQQEQQYNDALRQQQSRAAGDMAQAEAVRRTWQQRPALAPEKNPLLGRWESLGTGQRQAGSAAGLPPEMAQLANAMIGSLTSGLCDSMLGRGTIEFRPAGLVAMGSDGQARPMYRAEYRGGGSRVVVLPQGGTTFTHMIIDFDGADRATVATVGCGLARAHGAGRAHAAMANAHQGPAASTRAAAQSAQFDGSWNTRWGDGHAVLELVQTGADVSGTYAGSSQGKVTGRITGNVLTGHWTGSAAPNDHGGFVLKFSADGKTFSGTWGTGMSRNSGGPWVGTRQ